MHCPAPFREDRLPVLHDAIRRIALATLVTTGPEGIHATAVPLLLDPDDGPNGTLIGHIARKNPQWQGTDPSAEALAVFTGPHAYVSPSWYASKAETGKVVPTWNYVAIHARGPVEFFDDPARLLATVRALTALHESGRPEPWAVEDAPSDYIDAMLKAIVGVRLPIARLDGQWKMSQNRTEPDRRGVADGLLRDGMTAVAAAVAS